MSRSARRAPGGLVYHALNRAAARLPLLQKEGDFDAFERIMDEAMERHAIRLPAHSQAEMESQRRRVRRGTPLGDEAWRRRIAVELGLEESPRPRGRPRKRQDERAADLLTPSR